MIAKPRMPFNEKFSLSITDKKETMLVIISYCLYNNRGNPPNILHGWDQPEFVEKFTNIIYDSEFRFYRCDQNALAFLEIKNFLDI